jgi:asparagine synthase (glutamine-hydrolysing)
MADTSRRLWITFNGEIYNFQELREDLAAHGYRFQTRTDTEVILAAYARWGVGSLSRLKGMFAFAIYDQSERQLLLARDRLGKKPLFLAESASEIAFSSELYPLRAAGVDVGPVDPMALNFYLSCGYIPGARTIYRNVRKVLPGHAMLLNLDTRMWREWAYWEAPVKQLVAMTEAEGLEQLESRLREAVRRRLVADVPVGAFLSGGLDSSLVVAIMQELSPSPVRTFTIAFSEGAYDESRYARIVARHFGTDHHEFHVRPEFLEILPDLVRHVGEPFADPSILPTYYVCRETRHEVTVALSGDGGDELFAGYRTYVPAMAIYYAARYLPVSLRCLGGWAATFLPRSLIGRAQLARLALNPDDAFVQGYSSPFFNVSERRRILSPDLLGELDGILQEPEEYRKRWMAIRNGDFLEQITFSDLKVYLPDDILVKVDRASMAVSLEVRCPFLDQDVVEFSLGQLPSNFKLRWGLVKKYLLKRLARRLLPRELPIYRKQGFALPLREWFRGPWLDFLREALVGLDPGLVNRDYSEELVRRHCSGTSDESYRLFALLMLALWCRDQQSREQIDSFSLGRGALV